MTVQSELDELIDWYQKHQPFVVGRLIPVVATEGTIRHFATKRGVRGGPFVYRDCEIVPIRETRRRRPRQRPDDHG